MSAHENQRTFEAKKAFKEVFRSISASEQNEVFAEAAYPAYTHANPLIDRLFWGRLAVVERHIAGTHPKAILDFGCGSGIMSWILAQYADVVLATDTVPQTFERMKEAVEFPENIEFIGASKLEKSCEALHIDRIIALDVLEHVEDLRSTLGLFKRILGGRGQVIISGPTENVLYKIGRLVAGRQFTGDYHRTDIGKIKEVCREFGSVHEIKKLYPLIHFFDIFALEFN